MEKQRFRRQVGDNTPNGDRITIGHVSSNGEAVKNARVKGCFGAVMIGRKGGLSNV
jgi:hypothetical protein